MYGFSIPYSVTEYQVNYKRMRFHLRDIVGINKIVFTESRIEGLECGGDVFNTCEQE